MKIVEMFEVERRVIGVKGLKEIKVSYKKHSIEFGETLYTIGIFLNK